MSSKRKEYCKTKKTASLSSYRNSISKKQSEPSDCFTCILYSKEESKATLLNDKNFSNLPHLRKLGYLSEIEKARPTISAATLQ